MCPSIFLSFLKKASVLWVSGRAQACPTSPFFFFFFLDLFTWIQSERRTKSLYAYGCFDSCKVVVVFGLGEILKTVIIMQSPTNIPAPILWFLRLSQLYTSFHLHQMKSFIDFRKNMHYLVLN